MGIMWGEIGGLVLFCEFSLFYVLLHSQLHPFIA